jgi:ATP-dependent exoDNAse (exonuclease V) beta subunit
MIVFDEPTHTYTNTENGKKMTSVTTLLGQYKPKFDKHLHAARVAKREGVPKQMVLDQWQNKCDVACEKGTKIHKVMEDYIVDNKQEPQFAQLYSTFEESKPHIPKFKNIESEFLVYNTEYNIAGLADLIFVDGDSFFIGDFKTNRRFRFFSTYNDYHKYPLQHLSVCEFNSYCLQLSMYAHLYEEMTGKKCKHLVIYYLVDGQWKYINLNYMKTEIRTLLAVHMNSQKYDILK